jgi:Fic family protein
MDNLHKADLYKQAIDEHRPFEGHMLKELQAYYRIDLTWSSNAIEGNTLTLSETKVVLEDGLTVGGKPIKDYYEATGHAKAYDYMFRLIKSRSITEADIKELHRLFYMQIGADSAGHYRTKPVLITGSEYPVSQTPSIQKDMDSLAGWIAGSRDRYHPIEFAALLHKNFVFIHPFIDGNGRVARLLMNTALLQDRYLPAIIPPVLRNEYVAVLEKAHTNDAPFKDFICERIIETEKDYARLLGIPLIGDTVRDKLAANQKIIDAKAAAPPGRNKDHSR